MIRTKEHFYIILLLLNIFFMYSICVLYLNPSELMQYTSIALITTSLIITIFINKLMFGIESIFEVFFSGWYYFKEGSKDQESINLILGLIVFLSEITKNTILTVFLLNLIFAAFGVHQSNGMLFAEVMTGLSIITTFSIWRTININLMEEVENNKKYIKTVSIEKIIFKRGSTYDDL